MALSILKRSTHIYLTVMLEHYSLMFYIVNINFSPCNRCVLIISDLHVRISNVCKRNKGLLDGLSTGPLEHVVWAAGLVVGPGKPCPAKRLLSHHGPGRLVVDVEVARRAPQHHSGLVREGPFYTDINMNWMWMY